ncbi:MAG: DUF6440 family protein [Clostridiaceae bacterium]
MFNKEKESKKKFKVIYDEKSESSYIKILVDTQTGVNYLFNCKGYAGGLTVLLDSEGKPVITHI